MEAESDEEPQKCVTPSGDQETMSYPGDQSQGVMDDDMGYRVQGTFHPTR